MNLYSRYYQFIAVIFFMAACGMPDSTAQKSSHKHTNKLINESSPYLLQHAHNPVNWYPWGKEALDKAKKENKLIIISVGYAACHWCHVMEHESFEDSIVAEIMNKHFVAIKVDREERPDVDDVYMSACHLSSGGSCGWPLNTLALPDGRPFWAGTYFPKDNWKSILDYFIKMRADNPQNLEDAATKITEGIQSREMVPLADTEAKFSRSEFEGVFDMFVQSIDFKLGGKKERTNKFPMPNNYQFLLQYYEMTEDKKALDATTVTLDNMAMGGIYDHVGGGFARYATDKHWKVPHFEKMLYDNAQLVSLYSSAYQLTRDPMYKQVVYETLEFVNREMTSKEGGFYSSLDADSEGEEGKFYVWTQEELDTVIKNPEEAKIFYDYYTVKKGGNWEGKKNILHRKKTSAELAKKYKISEEELHELIERCKQKVYAARTFRVRPGLDDKVLTSWNALMMKGYIDAYRVFDEPKFLSAALRNADFLLKKGFKKGYQLNRNYKDGKSSINGFLDDYALVIDAFLALYQATFDEDWLYKAKGLADYADKHFTESESQMYYYTSKLDDPLIARKMEVSDNVIPASNSVMAKNLLLLSIYFDDKDYEERSSTMMNNMLGNIKYHPEPSFFSNWCSVYALYVKRPYEVAIVGLNYQDLRKELDQRFLPYVVLLGGKDEGSLSLLEGKFVEGETMIYVCRNRICKLPTVKIPEAINLME